MDCETRYKYVIYLLRNLINGKTYIGQTIQLPSNRWKNGKGYASYMLIRKAIDKYGWENFEHIILEQFTGTPKEAGIKEQQYIDIYKSMNPEYGYNLQRSDGPVAPKMNDAAVEWMKQHPEFGLARAADMHRWRKEHPEEAKKITEKFSLAGHEARKRKVKCIETNTVYESATAAARNVEGASQSKICMCCRNQRNTCGGLHWEYEIEDDK